MFCDKSTHYVFIIETTNSEIIYLLTFQAGPSFDLPDREKMRRYGWSNGNISANGNCVLLETEHHSRGNTTSYMKRPQEVCKVKALRRLVGKIFD